MPLDPSNQLKRRFCPGLWQDENGALHVSIPELLSFHNIADTEENRAKVEQFVREARDVAASELGVQIREVRRSVRCPHCGNTKTVRCTANDEKAVGDFQCPECGSFFDGNIEEGFSG